jgi:hypothetical protein
VYEQDKGMVYGIMIVNIDITTTITTINTYTSICVDMHIHTYTSICVGMHIHLGVEPRV